MAIDHLQDKIRKLKVPIVLEIGTTKQLPEHLLEQEGSLLGALGRFCRELLETMAGKVPAVRFRLARFALLGGEGLALLQQLLAEAKAKGYYVMLDLPEALTYIEEAVTHARESLSELGLDDLLEEGGQEDTGS